MLQRYKQDQYCHHTKTGCFFLPQKGGFMKDWRKGNFLRLMFRMSFQKLYFRLIF